MIKCPYCQAIHVDNTVFCGECGQYLLEGHDRSTDPIGIDVINWRGETVSDAGTARSPQLGTGPMSLGLKIGEGGREVEAVLNKVILLGRVDPGAHIFPEIDLTDDGPSAQTVSRRHAGIFKQGTVVVVEDMGSINGTFVNGKRLVPYLPETLGDGDVLQLGRLLIKVRLRAQ